MSTHKIKKMRAKNGQKNGKTGIQHPLKFKESGLASLAWA